MFNSYFSTQHQICILVSVVFIVISFAFLLAKKHRYALLGLIFAAIFYKYFIITLDDYLNFWDECFHALVAKNLSYNPLLPVLYKTPLLPFDYRDWSGNHIWLHKQPLFLWQSALSIKLFGATEFAYRLPSLVLSVLAVPVIYRIGQLLMSHVVGYLAALLFIISFYTNGLTSGYRMSAENDLVFMFYVLGSCWAYLEYRRSGKMYFIFLIALFSGFAMLTKWLVGLLVYSSWFTNIIVENKEGWKSSLKKMTPLLKSLSVTSLIVLPWFVYTFSFFPEESSYEFTLNARHFSEVVEGHTGTFAYHFEQMNEIYYPFNYNILIPVIFIGIFLIPNRLQRITIVLFILLPFLFFTIAKTKMPSFTYVIFPYVVLLISIVLYSLFEFLKTKMNKPALVLVSVFSVSLLLYYFMAIERIQYEHTDQNKYNGNRDERINNKKEYFLLAAKIKEAKDKVVLFNMSFPYYIDMMFYTDITTYPYLPNTDQIKELKNKGYVVYIRNDNHLPQDILENKDIKKLSSNLETGFKYAVTP